MALIELHADDLPAYERRHVGDAVARSVTRLVGRKLRGGAERGAAIHDGARYVAWWLQRELQRFYDGDRVTPVAIETVEAVAETVLRLTRRHYTREDPQLPRPTSGR